MPDVYVEMRTHPICPSCGSKTGVGTIDHLRMAPDFKTSWSCKDCGKCIHLRLQHGVLTECAVNPMEHWVKGVAVLKLEPQDHPIYFAVEHRDYRPKSGEHEDELDRHASRQFLFEEHSCPTNWFKPILVMDGKDSDPHGLLKFVGWREMDIAPYPTQDERVQKLVEEFQRG